MVQFFFKGNGARQERAWSSFVKAGKGTDKTTHDPIWFQGKMGCAKNGMGLFCAEGTRGVRQNKAQVQSSLRGKTGKVKKGMAQFPLRGGKG